MLALMDLPKKWNTALCTEFLKNTPLKRRAATFRILNMGKVLFFLSASDLRNLLKPSTLKWKKKTEDPPAAQRAILIPSLKRTSLVPNRVSYNPTNHIGGKYFRKEAPLSFKFKKNPVSEGINPLNSMMKYISGAKRTIRKKALRGIEILLNRRIPRSATRSPMMKTKRKTIKKQAANTLTRWARKNHRV
jgi:hypothetical protein